MTHEDRIKAVREKSYQAAILRLKGDIAKASTIERNVNVFIASMTHPVHKEDLENASQEGMEAAHL